LCLTFLQSGDKGGKCPVCRARVGGIQSPWLARIFGVLNELNIFRERNEFVYKS
jgi:hypothetical protein